MGYQLTGWADLEQPLNLGSIAHTSESGADFRGVLQSTLGLEAYGSMMHADDENGYSGKLEASDLADAIAALSAALSGNRISGDERTWLSGLKRVLGDAAELNADCLFTYS